MPDASAVVRILRTVINDADGGPIARTNLGEEVAHRLRKAVLSGELASGTRVVQDEWAQRLGVSRMPVRDAVVRLEVEGLLTVSASGATTVAAVLEKDIVDGYQVNSTIAGVIARRAAHKLTDDEIVGLRAVQSELGDAVAAGDIDTAQARDFEFHRRINRAGGSVRLLSLLRLMSAGVPPVTIGDVPELATSIVRDHDAIVDAFAARDGEAARQAMETHLLGVQDKVIALLAGRGLFASEGDA